MSQFIAWPARKKLRTEPQYSPYGAKRRVAFFAASCHVAARDWCSNPADIICLKPPTTAIFHTLVTVDL